jgi:hypothetical protein
MNFLLQATQPAPSQLASDIIAIIGAVSGAVALILGAWAMARSGSNSTRITNTSRAVDTMRSDLTTVALRTPTDPTDKPKGH